MFELTNLPELNASQRQIEAHAFWERAVFASWNGSGLLPPGVDTLLYMRKKSEEGMVFCQLERLRPRRH